jgi:hypothetical protein
VTTIAATVVLILCAGLSASTLTSSYTVTDETAGRANI